MERVAIVSCRQRLNPAGRERGEFRKEKKRPVYLLRNEGGVGKEGAARNNVCVFWERLHRENLQRKSDPIRR